MTRKELVAHIICKEVRKRDPKELEPGDLPKIDGICPNGDPGHFAWRQETLLAKKILKALDNY